MRLKIITKRGAGVLLALAASLSLHAGSALWAIYGGVAVPPQPQPIRVTLSFPLSEEEKAPPVIGNLPAPEETPPLAETLPAPPAGGELPATEKKTSDGHAAPPVIEKERKPTLLPLPAPNPKPAPQNHAFSKSAKQAKVFPSPNPPAFAPPKVGQTGAETMATLPSFSASYLRNPPPPYPPAAKRKGAQGTVLLDIWVTAEGEASHIQIATSSGHKILDDAAKKAALRWRFVPARQGGQNVAGRVKAPVEFRLR